MKNENLIRGIGNADGFGEETEKWCSRCQSHKHEELFPPYHTWCYDCYQEYQREYQKGWNEKNPTYQQDHRKEINTRHVIYFIYGKGKLLYVGSTRLRDRIKQHLKGKSNLNISTQEWVDMGVDRLQYVDVTELIEVDEYDDDVAKAERFYLERLFIEECSPELNKCLPPCQVDDWGRVEYLKGVYENELTEWIEKPIIKIVSPVGKTTFNYSDLVLNDNEDSQS